MPDVSCFHHIRNRADRVLDWHRWVDAPKAVNVNIVRPEPAQRIGEKVLDRDRAPIDSCPKAGGIAQRAELDTEYGLLAVAASQSLAQQQFIVAHAVVIAGVEQSDSGVKCGMDRGDALGLVGWAVEVGHSHAPQSDRGYARTDGAEHVSDHTIFSYQVEIGEV